MEVNKKIESLISENEVCLFMKGTPDAPQCGFSMAVANVLKHLNVDFKGINVLEDENLILVEGSVPGSKNGIVTLSDAVKHDLPKEAPFPAGLKASEASNDKTIPVSENTSGKLLENEGAQGEN